jgi:hypothetical protein
MTGGVLRGMPLFFCYSSQKTAASSQRFGVLADKGWTSKMLLNYKKHAK